jgi:hypothetical protein
MAFTGNLEGANSSSQAEKKNRENERFLQAVFDGIQDGISSRQGL